MQFLRRSVPFLLALSAAFCASTSTEPTQSTTTTTTTSTGLQPSANVHATGNLTFSNCDAEGKCTFQGLVINDGPDCASNVRGVTHLFDASGREIGAQSWDILGRVRRGETSYSGCCFAQSSVNAYRTYRTDVSFESLLCI